ncbi:hypothetical protein [Streptomyces sp. Ru72]|uniref:hypothetical protein n=1 Tax=Streptomyces sp. Ru72 TaxID=2080747 RepID=UPI0011B004B8|nr:hypothetical protein [Streptomyces sp. Ru72]
MADSPWAALTSVERDLMVCASEAWGILAYATNGKDEDGHAVDLPRIVLGLVDRGWVHVHRLEPWRAPDGQAGATYGPPIPRAEVPEVLKDPAVWDDPDDPDWIGAVTLSATETWRALNRQHGHTAE